MGAYCAEEKTVVIPTKRHDHEAQPLRGTKSRRGEEKPMTIQKSKKKLLP